jgi:hypothetical protein
MLQNCGSCFGQHPVFCANIFKLYFAFKEGQVLEFSNLSIVLKEACLCYEIVKFILNSDKYYKKEIPVQVGLDSGWT